MFSPNFNFVPTFVTKKNGMFVLGVGFVFDGLAIFDESYYYQPKRIVVLSPKLKTKKFYSYHFSKAMRV